MVKPATAQWFKEAVGRGSKAEALANLLIGEIPLGRNDCYQPEAGTQPNFPVTAFGRKQP